MFVEFSFLYIKVQRFDFSFLKNKNISWWVFKTQKFLNIIEDTMTPYN